MTWVLILLFHANVAPAVALTSVPGFATNTECEDAGRATAKRISGGHQVRWSCVPQGAEKSATR
jgi:hypothetical protein